MKLTFDVVIIGGGPSGLSAAIYLRRYNLTCCIIEKNAPGGKLLIINDIQNYPGFEKIAGYDLATKMYNQALKLGTEFIFNEVLDIDVLSDKKIIKTKDKEIICQGIIIATGRIP
ncbi:MAG: FAD-dependent oxidoreductase, partial [Bacilli bacterium]